MSSVKAWLVTILLVAPSLAVAGSPPCAGDCNGDGEVGVNELIKGVNIFLGSVDVSQCPAVDSNGNGTVAINELVQAVNSALRGCSGGGATLADVQAIFSARCAVPGCHIPPFPANDLDLTEGAAFDQTVGVEPFNPNAVAAGIVRVDPGDALNSYVLIKVSGPPPELGSQMPLFADPLSDSEVRTIREWIDGGALP